jgi:hypothetical protein
VLVLVEKKELVVNQNACFSREEESVLAKGSCVSGEEEPDW